MTYPARARQLKRKGLCVSCGHHKAAKGHVLCEECLQKRRVAASVAYHSKTDRGPVGKRLRAVKTQTMCSICDIRPGKFLDHDHKTQRTRGHLCPACNAGLGMFQDNPSLLRKAAYYLEWHHSQAR
jgi:Recombination endonuclease VII